MKAAAVFVLALPLAAQSPFEASVAAYAGMARFTHHEGGSQADGGALVGLLASARYDRVSLDAHYATGPLGGGRSVRDAAVAVAWHVTPVLSAGVALATFADLPAPGGVRRWWAAEMAGRAVVPLPATPLSFDARIGLSPVGGVNAGPGFDTAWSIGTGVAMRSTTRPVTMRLGYHLRRANGGGMADVLETVTFGAAWHF